MSTTEPIDQHGVTSPLVRPRHKRVVAGVAQGLGAHLNVDPVIFRIAFVVLALAGGSGFALYGLAWLLIPEEGSAISRGADLLDRLQRGDRIPISAAIVAALCGLFLLGGLDRPSGPHIPLLILAGAATFAALRFSSGRRDRPPRAGVPGAAPWWLWTLAGVLVILGLAELVLGWSWGWAASAVVVTGGLVLAVAGRRWAGAVALLAILSATIGGALWQHGIGDRQYQAEVATTGHRSYHLGAGRLIVDLSALRPAAGHQTDIDISVGVGQVVVLLPSGVTAHVDGSAGVGDVALLGDRSSGTGVRRSIATAANPVSGTSGAVGILDVHTKAGIGEVLVEPAGAQAGGG